jgi:hypothetical protein
VALFELWFFFYSNFPKVLASFGLFLDLLGAVIVFYFGVPEVINRSGGIIVTFGHDKNAENRAKKYERISRVGICFLITGFLIQIIANWV